MKQINDFLVFAFYIGFILIFTIIFTVTIEGCGLFHFGHITYNIILILMFLFSFIPALLCLAIFNYSRKKWKLADQNSVYNPFRKIVELHLGKTGNLNSIEEVIINSKQINSDVYFVTDHISEKALVRKLQKRKMTFLIQKATWLQRLLYLPISRVFKWRAGVKHKQYPCIACTILLRK